MEKMLQEPRFGANSAKVGRVSSQVGRCGPRLTNNCQIRPKLAELGHFGPKCTKLLAPLDRNWSMLVTFSPKSAKLDTSFDPKSAKVDQVWSKLVKRCQNLVKIGRVSANMEVLVEFAPNLDSPNNL